MTVIVISLDFSMMDEINKFISRRYKKISKHSTHIPFICLKVKTTMAIWIHYPKHLIRYLLYYYEEQDIFTWTRTCRTFHTWFNQATIVHQVHKQRWKQGLRRISHMMFLSRSFDLDLTEWQKETLKCMLTAIHMPMSMDQRCFHFIDPTESKWSGFGKSTLLALLVAVHAKAREYRFHFCLGNANKQEQSKMKHKIMSLITNIDKQESKQLGTFWSKKNMRSIPCIQMNLHELTTDKILWSLDFFVHTRDHNLSNLCSSTIVLLDDFDVSCYKYSKNIHASISTARVSFSDFRMFWPLCSEWRSRSEIWQKLQLDEDTKINQKEEIG